MPLACVLVSDVTGSTALFESMDNAQALAKIDGALSRMRDLIGAAGGHCVKSKGDDVLSFFPTCDAAFAAAWSMIVEDWPAPLSIHAGAYFGEILNHADDIFGNAVNTASRLAELAKPGEILFGDLAYDRLATAQQMEFLAIGDIPLRGKEAATRVFSCSQAAFGTQTTVIPGAASVPDITTLVDLSLGTSHWQIVPGTRLSIGRASDRDIVINQPSVSRNHGALSISSGTLEYTDHSSAGSLVLLDTGQTLAVHRRTTLLGRSGEIVIGAGETEGRGNVIEFRAGVLQRG